MIRGVLGVACILVYYSLEAQPLPEREKDYQQLPAEGEIQLRADSSLFALEDSAWTGLRITTTPSGAEILVDQVSYGKTPLSFPDIAPGIYQIDVIHPFCLPETRTIIITEGERRLEHFDLELYYSALYIETEPAGATVWLLNRPIGKSPLSLLRLPAGEYTIRLENPLYHERLDTVQIAAGEEIHKSYLLPARFGEITILSEPPGAQVILDGVVCGITPVTLHKIASGMHIIQCRLDNYEVFRDELELSDNQHLSNTCKLEPTVGWLSIHTDPESVQVSIPESYRMLGNSPIDTTPLKPGFYALHFNKNYYASKDTVIAIVKGEHLQANIHLDCHRGNLHVYSSQSDAQVFLNDQLSGVTPCDLENLPAGQYNLLLRKDGYYDYREQIIIEKDKTVTRSPFLHLTALDRWQKRRWSAQMVAIPFPGGGQLVSGQYLRGVFYLGVFVSSLYFSNQASKDHESRKVDYQRAFNAYRSAVSEERLSIYFTEAQRAFDDMEEYERRAANYLILAAGIYSLQLADVIFFGGGKRPQEKDALFKNRGNVEPFTKMQQGNLHVGIRINFSLPR